MADINLQDIIDQANAKARQQQLMAMGFGILGARTGNPWTALGQGGLIGMQAGSQARQDYLKQAMEQFQLQKQAGLLDLAQKTMAEDQASQQPPSAQIAPQAGISPRTEAAFGPAGNTAGFQPLPPAPMTVPQGAAPQNVQDYMPPNWRQEIPRFGQAAALMSMDPKLMFEMTKAGSETKIGPDGTVTTMTGRPLYKQTDAGIQMFQPNGTPGPFLAYDKANTKAAAERNAAIEGAKTAAVEAAKFPYQIAEATGPGGVPLKGYAANLFGPPPVPGAQPTMPGIPPGVSLNLRGPVSPADLQRTMAEIGQGQAVGGGTIGQGMIAGPNPIAQKQAEANISAMAPVFAKQHEAIDTEAKAASDLKARLTEMSRLLDSFTPNMAAPARQRLAEAVRATQLPFAPDVANAVAGGDLNAMLMFRKNAIQTAFEAARNQMGGVPRNYFEIQMQLEANPSLSLTPEANKGILSIMLGVQQRALDKQTQRDKWLQDHQDLRGFEGEFNRTHPSTDYLPAVGTLKQQFGIADQQQAKPTPQQIVDELRKRGAVR